MTEMGIDTVGAFVFPAAADSREYLDSPELLATSEN